MYAGGASGFGADYRADASSLLDHLTHQLRDSGSDAALYALAVDEFNT